MKMTPLSLIFLVASSATAQSTPPEFKIDKFGSRKDLSVRDPQTGADIAIGSIGPEGFSAPNLFRIGPSIFVARVVTGSPSAAKENDDVLSSTLALAGSSSRGGTVQLPCGDIYVSSPIDNKYPRVLVRGCGMDRFHDSGNNSGFGTRILPVRSITVLKHRTPYSRSSSIFSGGGFTDITVDGNSYGTRLLEVDSIYGGIYDLNLLNSVGHESAYFTSGETGVDGAEAMDVQRAHIRLRVRQLDGSAAQNANGVVLEGSANANFSFNDDVQLDIQFKNGTALLCSNADNNIINIRGIRAAGGTGKLLIAGGISPKSLYGCGQNVFHHISGYGEIYAQGIKDPGVNRGITNKIDHLDTGNGTQFPTAGTGSSWQFYDAGRNVQAGIYQLSPIVAEGVNSLVTARENRANTTSLDVVNDSGDALRIRDRENKRSWGLNLDNGNLRVVQFAGSGGLVDLRAGLKLSKVSAAALPSCNSASEGALFSVYDSRSAAFNAVLTAGGSNHVMAYCNGTNWTVH